MLGKRKKGRPRISPENSLQYYSCVRYGDYEKDTLRRIKYYTNEKNSQIFRASLRYYLADLERKHSF